MVFGSLLREEREEKEGKRTIFLREGERKRCDTQLHTQRERQINKDTKRKRAVLQKDIDTKNKNQRKKRWMR